jgi:Xaa-Pro aminopeptidase
MEKEMAQSAAVVDRIELWNDGMGNEWREALPGFLEGTARIGIEPDLMPPVVRSYVDTLVNPDRLTDLMALVSEMRMIKSSDELQIARHAGEVGIAMMGAGRSAIGEGVPEYEVALSATQAGTRKAAELLKTHYSDKRMSPSIHFMQIMASGKEMTMTHHRASTKELKIFTASSWVLTVLSGWEKSPTPHRSQPTRQRLTVRPQRFPYWGQVLLPRRFTEPTQR